MRGVLICIVLVILSISVSNTQKTNRPFNPENKLFIITLDGFRWQEIFRGADSALINDPSYNSDISLTRAMFWADSKDERRTRLMPFLWNVVGKQGELYGNRDYKNKVNVSNPYALSYPGYSELLTGEVDYSIYGNDKRVNKNKNILEVLNNSKGYAGKVAAFTSWDMFPYILDKDAEKEKGFKLNSGLQDLEGKNLTGAERMVNRIQKQASRHNGETRYDELTYIACKEYLLQHKPSVVFLSFSGTDNAAHDGRYDEYLKQAHNTDRMISDLWNLIQSMPEYQDKTTLLITTDHGRGDDRSTWDEHGFFTGGSSQTWYGLLGPTTIPYGEMKMRTQVYQKELNGLIREILTR